MAHVTHRLRTAFEGALAGGGDPASSPLYVFGPFLRTLVAAGAAEVCFGASIWLVVVTVVAVSVMYRRVMTWITDGSGGSGLCEEELGPWAVKVNSAITFVEYTLTFLVSIAALVTFAADRAPWVAKTLYGFPLRTLLAIALSFATAGLVNRGPRVAARIFGPATAGVLLLLWAMMLATIWRRGLVLPKVDFRAFGPAHLPITLRGYVQILALMTGVEVFANLVSAYEGSAAERSRLAFRSLVLIMGTTTLTMLIVGPAMLGLTDPMRHEVSVFTQAMDSLLPAPLPWLGTVVGIAVLVSAAAASTQGLQALALGLRARHYLPARFGQRNAHDVADRPAWAQAGISALAFVLLGTKEETYLALYAVGVFVLLSLTGWAAVKRLGREARESGGARRWVAAVAAVLAALLTSSATATIAWERFREGAWLYLVMIPALYAALTWTRRRLGPPVKIEARLTVVLAGEEPLMVDAPLPPEVLCVLDGKATSEPALSVARELAETAKASVRIAMEAGSTERERLSASEYLRAIERATGTNAGSELTEVEGELDERPLVAEELTHLPRGGLVVRGISRRSRREQTRRTLGLGLPTLLLKPGDDWRSRWPSFKTTIVAMDGSRSDAILLGQAISFARLTKCRLIIASIPEGSESEQYERAIRTYLGKLEDLVRQAGLEVESRFGGSGPARTLLHLAKEVSADLVIVGSHGRAGHERRAVVPLGSVTERLLEQSSAPLLLVPVWPNDAKEGV